MHSLLSLSREYLGICEGRKDITKKKRERTKAIKAACETIWCKIADRQKNLTAKDLLQSLLSKHALKL